jgi:hypothetical protein
MFALRTSNLTRTDAEHLGVMRFSLTTGVRPIARRMLSTSGGDAIVVLSVCARSIRGAAVRANESVRL